MEYSQNQTKKVFGVYTINNFNVSLGVPQNLAKNSEIINNSSPHSIVSIIKIEFLL